MSNTTAAASGSSAAERTDVIDRAGDLTPGSPLHTLRRQRLAVVLGSQASHDALLFEPVAGLGVADRLRVALHCCQASHAQALAEHYRALLQQPEHAAEAASPALPALLHWAETLTIDPRRGDRAALHALHAAGLADPATVALAQLVAFLSYQTRVVAGLRAIAQPVQAPAEAPAVAPAEAPAEAHPAVANAAPAPATAATAATAASSASSPGPIRHNGFTSDALSWRSWLQPLALDQATPLQLAVLDESHAQARTSEYYLTLAHQPLMLRHRSAAYNAIMYAPGGLPRAERELGALVVSVSNGCVYCTSVHAQRYAQLARRHDTVWQVFDDPASAGSTPRERAIAQFALAVTQRPHTLAAADLAPLRARGLGDAELIDLLHAVAIFGWANRLMHNLGEPVHPASAARGSA